MKSIAFYPITYPAHPCPNCEQPPIWFFAIMGVIVAGVLAYIVCSIISEIRRDRKP